MNNPDDLTLKDNLNSVIYIAVRRCWLPVAEGQEAIKKRPLVRQTRSYQPWQLTSFLALLLSWATQALRGVE